MDASGDDVDIYRESIPPSLVFCLARGANEAAVWWLIRGEDGDTAVPTLVDIEHTQLPALAGVTAWQVMRYRRDRSPPFEWRLKGSTTTASERITHAILSGLSTGFEYRFTVRAVSGNNVGVESDPSNAVVLEETLPAGWFRIAVNEEAVEGLHAGELKRMYYYANIKTRQTSWERPDSDPYFVSESVYCRFNKREHESLRRLYDEEIANCGIISIDGCRDMLLEVGERVTRKQLALLFQAYEGDTQQIKLYPSFINVCMYAKTHNHQVALTLLQSFHSYIKRKISSALRRVACFGPTPTSNLTALSTPSERLGNWTLHYSELADRAFYRHSETQQTCWEMPDEVRFYVEPIILLPKIIKLLEFDNYQTLVMMFSEVNRDCSGYISEYETRLIIAKIGLFVPRGELQGMLLDRDVDGRGQLAFNEFIDLVAHLLTRDNNNALQGVLETMRDISREQDPSLDGENSSVGYFDQCPLNDDVGSVQSNDDCDIGRRVRFVDRHHEGFGEEKDGTRSDKTATLCRMVGCLRTNTRGNRRRYQVGPEEDGSNLDDLGRQTQRFPSAQKLLETEEAKLMDATDSSLHLKDCMCGCRKIVELFDGGE